jgi:hypothetical protein
MDASLEPTRVPVPYGWSTDDVLLTVEPAHVVVDDIPPQDPGARGTVIALRVGEEEDQLGVHWAALPEPYAPVGLDEQTFLQLLPPRMTSGRGYLHHEAVESGTLPKSPKARARYFYEALVGMAKTPEKAVCEAIERIALEFTDTDGIRWRRLANQHEIAELPPLGARP